MTYSFPTLSTGNLGISTKSHKVPTPNLITSKFGNGYEQRQANGLNYLRIMWSPLIWSPLTGSDLTTVQTFLNNISSGAYATITDPFDGSTYKLVLDGPWTMTPLSGNVVEIQAPFRQVFDA